MFGKIKCGECGMILDGQTALKNSGNTFCSEDCSEKYRSSHDDHNCC